MSKPPTPFPKIPPSELLRLACIYAEQDRTGWLAAMENCRGDPHYAEAIAKAESFLQQLKRYRQHRWGKSVGDKLDSLPTTYVNPSSNT